MDWYRFKYLEILNNMYALYIMNSNQITVQWFQSEKDCLNHISGTQNPKYKIEKDGPSLFFINAMYWDILNKKISIDTNLAKEIKRNELRFLRQSLFDKLDSLYMKNFQLQEEEKTKEIVNLKQQLRDITLIDLPNDLNELLYYIPDIFIKIQQLTF